MSVGFINQLACYYPGAELSLVVKKGIHELLTLFPAHHHQFIFDKEEFKGAGGLIKFGRTIRSKEKFDLFFCLPDSFSSALMAYSSGAVKTIGYKKEMRQVLLTHSYKKPVGLHRAEEYTRLLEYFTGTAASTPDVRLHHNFTKKDYVVVNVNSEASSRRLTVEKAAELINTLKHHSPSRIVLVGAKKEKEFVDKVFHQTGIDSIENLAGETSLVQLATILASAKLVVTTDSGPAHLANALGTQTIVLFGAGREENTAPYRKEYCTTIRLGELPCEPCQKNICVVYGIPQCLERLDSMQIVQTAQKYLP